MRKDGFMNKKEIENELRRYMSPSRIKRLKESGGFDKAIEDSVYAMSQIPLIKEEIFKAMSGRLGDPNQTGALSIALDEISTRLQAMVLLQKQINNDQDDKEDIDYIAALKKSHLTASLSDLKHFINERKKNEPKNENA